MKICVVGGGASGMMAALIAAKNGADVILLERNEKLGKKIYITGKGRCNLTNDCSEEEFLSNVVTNSKFLFSAVYAFPPSSTIEFFSNLGLQLKSERGNRIFPMSDKASDVTKCLEQALRKYNVDIRLDSNTISVKVLSDSTFSLTTIKDIVLCDKLILATGGVSYPTTGSDGKMFSVVKSLGHTIVPLKASLVDFITVQNYSLQGLSLKNVQLSLINAKGKIVASEFGEMLFTHTGISGPIALTLSTVATHMATLKGAKLSIDLKPALTEEQLDNRLQRDFQEFSNKNLINSLFKLLPESLIDIIIKLSGISPYKKVNQVTSAERKCIVTLLKNFAFDIASLGDISQAIVTSGGVDVREVNPKTMESKLIKNLYFGGEMLDIDALTGGFNLQCAFSTGFVAGLNAAKED